MDHLFFYLVVGGFAGLFSGLLGVGGGLIFVPALTYAFKSQGFPVDILIHIVIATSLASIVFTSISAILSHLKYSRIRWSYARRIALGLVPGAWLGTRIALSLSAKYLEMFFGVFMFVMAFQMLLSYRFAERHEPARFRASILVPCGGVIGSLATLLGISGGGLVVPFMNWRGLPLSEAISISAVTNFVLAFSGAIFYLLPQAQTLSHPQAGMLGLVYGPALFGVVLGSIPTARLGVILSQRLPPQWIRLFFVLFLLTIGFDFLFFH